MGSSLGGLISSYAGRKRPEVFGHVGAMSPSTWWDNLYIVGQVNSTPAAPARPLKVYVDVGTSSDGQADTVQLAGAYRGVGYVDGTSFKYVVQQGASHNETYWRQRLPDALRFLLGPGR
jgi:pullulanase